MPAKSPEPDPRFALSIADAARYGQEAAAQG
jgi:hypothetical protein